MNLVLFEAAELAAPLPATDARSRHIVEVLKRGAGDTFDAGVINGAKGKATVHEISAGGLTLSFAWDAPPPPLRELTLLIGLPRPQTARDILRDATTLGATCIHFMATERADKNYATSSLWTSGEWRRHCIAGAAQAFDTRIPDVTWTHTLESALAARVAAAAPSARIALDNYEASVSLKKCHLIGDTFPSPAGFPGPAILAIGPERGWGPADRNLLISTGFTLAHLGSRVLRTETAVIAALAILGAD